MEVLFVITSTVLLYMLFFAVALGFYFIPTIVALVRKHPDKLWIFIVNFGLGATALFWILALVWALNDNWVLENRK